MHIQPQNAGVPAPVLVLSKCHSNHSKEAVSTQPATPLPQTSSDYSSSPMHLLLSKCISWLAWSLTWVCSREVSFRISVHFKFYFPRKQLLCYMLHRQIDLLSLNFKKTPTNQKQLNHRRSRLLDIFCVLMFHTHSFSRSFHPSPLQALRNKWHV